jgi:hypothetical protein
MEQFILYIVDIHYRQVPTILVREGATMPTAMLEKIYKFISRPFSISSIPIDIIKILRLQIKP